MGIVEQSQIIIDFTRGGGKEELPWIHQKRSFSVKPDQLGMLPGAHLCPGAPTRVAEMLDTY